MTSGTNGTSIAEAIDVVEETYEYMLAYAAQGRGRDDDDESIRDYLKRAEAALGVIAAATPQAAGGDKADEAFLEIVRTDAVRARAVMRFVLARRTIGSQIIDNLNASIHLRALLTDLFLLDEALKISGI
jgi:hypothetical protein